MSTKRSAVYERALARLHEDLKARGVSVQKEGTEALYWHDSPTPRVWWRIYIDYDNQHWIVAWMNPADPLLGRSRLYALRVKLLPAVLDEALKHTACAEREHDR